ncbi:MAG: hypothetical protein ACK4YT_04310 [Sphingomonas sp.]
MAYMAFDRDGSVGERAVSAAAGPAFNPVTYFGADRSNRLSALEWSVVALARRDRPSSLREPSRMSLALGSLFGRQDNPRLADPRLEALRRTAVLAWHRGAKALSDAEKEAFTAAGFTPGQYRTLLASIGAARLNKGRYA